MRYLSFLLILLCGSARADVTASRIDYHGWAGAYRLTNGTVELVYVPQVGRIMRYGYIGKSNVLWENPGMAGKVVKPSANLKDWANFGGDKLWPAPQDRWGWPPDPFIDPGTYSVTVSANKHLLIMGQPSVKSGMRFSRDISLTRADTGVIIVNTMTNTDKESVHWGLWEITQVDDPEVAGIPAAGNEGFKLLTQGQTPTNAVTVTNGIARVRRDPKKSGKIGSTAAGGWVISERNGVRFRVAASPSEKRNPEYPDGGCRQEVYWNQDPDKYVELELLGPVVHIAPGESVTQTVRWTLERLQSKGK
jgi:hypothetical protein